MATAHPLPRSDETRSEASRLQEDFTKEVHRCFGELTTRGMPPNEACALSLKVAAGVVPLPPSLEELHEDIAAAQQSKKYDQLAAKVAAFFKSPDAVFASFWPSSSSSSSSSQSKEQQQQQQQSSQAAVTASPAAAAAAAAGDQPQPMETSPADSNNEAPAATSTPPLASPSNNTATTSSSSNNPSNSAGPSSSIDMDAVHDLHAALVGTRDPGVLSAVMAGFSRLIEHIWITTGRGQLNPAFAREVVVLLANPQMEDVENHVVVDRMASVLVGLPSRAQDELQEVLQSWKERDMRMVLCSLQNYITLTLYSERAVTSGVAAATKLLGLVAAANDAAGVLHYSEFYNDAVNNEDFNVKEDFRRWKQYGRPGAVHAFSFCEAAFVYDPASKARIMALENSMNQFQEFESSMMQAFLHGQQIVPYMYLKVRRGSYLLQDTLIQVSRAKENGSLKKPLKVKFMGEEGVDEGGVQKEFFQLLVKEAFKSDFGMFSYDEALCLHWFRPSRMELDLEFELIGILVGLAIYNNHILDFQFPLVLYRKLLDQELGLADLQELHPEVHTSLHKLLAMTPEEVEGLGLVFQVDLEMLGEIEAVELIPGGATTPVTAANRQQYVEQYTKHLLVDSIDRQFGAFKRGFLRMCSGAALTMFRPAELEALVCGGQVLDLEALEASTSYEDGYTAASPIIKWFWQVVHALDGEDKKKFLSFITGSNRVPIKGLGHLSPPFVISRNGPHSERLPTAHTCFNHLLLPEYRDKDALQQRLLLAIENFEGFGLM